MVERNEQDEPKYEVGYRCPPKETRFKPGQCAYPKGRPRGSPNLKTALERMLRKKVSVRRGDKTSKVMMIEAMAENFTLKAVQGDRHAAGVIISLAQKAGVFDARNDVNQNRGTERNVPAAIRDRPSEAYVESVDPNLLSKEEQIDLSRIAEQIDAVGVIELSDEDFARLKQIVNKGRGKIVVPSGGDDLDQAA